MEESCLAHRLRDDEREQFENQGYLVVPGVLSDDKVARLAAAADDSMPSGARSGT